MNIPPALLQGKKGLIMGLANKRSIAWGIAKNAREHGAELAFTYQGENLKKRVQPLADEVGSDTLIQCDVTDSQSVKNAFAEIEKKWGKLDFLIHAIAFSDKEGLKGRYIDTTKENFLNTMHISCFSFVEACKYAAPLMKDGGSCVTLTYYGAEQVMPHYNVMGVAKAALEASVRYAANDLGRENIRVNAISAGPIKTLAAAGIGDFKLILNWNELNSPLRKNVTTDEVGKSALSLISDLGTAITGEVLHVDAGYHTVGMIATDNAHETSELLAKFNPQG